MDIANRRPMRQALDLLDPQDGESILDVGCGTGHALKEIQRRAQCTLTGADPSHTMLTAARTRLGLDVRLTDSALGGLPFTDGSFDAVLALNVLYFCDHEGKMLRDLHRVLRPGGRLVAYVTHRQTMEKWSFAKAGYHRLYDADQLHQSLEQGGFASSFIVIHEANIGMGARGLFAFAVR